MATKFTAKTKTTARGTKSVKETASKSVKPTGNYFIDVEYVKTTYYSGGSLLHYAVTSKVTPEMLTLIKLQRGTHYAETAKKQPIITSPMNGGLITQFEYVATDKKFYVRENANIKMFNTINKKVIEGTMAPTIASMMMQPLLADAMLG